MFDNIMMTAFVLFMVWMMIGFFKQMERRRDEREKNNIDDNDE
jgi:hypothetical protein